jgi:hypothetical protein
VYIYFSHLTVPSFSVYEKKGADFLALSFGGKDAWRTFAWNKLAIKTYDYSNIDFLVEDA